MDALCISLLYSAMPNFRERCIKQLCIFSRIDLINKGDVCSLWKYQGKLFISSQKDVINTILSTINNLNVFHDYFFCSLTLR